MSSAIAILLLSSQHQTSSILLPPYPLHPSHTNYQLAIGGTLSHPPQFLAKLRYCTTSKYSLTHSPTHCQILYYFEVLTYTLTHSLSDTVLLRSIHLHTHPLTYTLTHSLSDTVLLRSIQESEQYSACDTMYFEIYTSSQHMSLKRIYLIDEYDYEQIHVQYFLSSLHSLLLSIYSSRK